MHTYTMAVAVNNTCLSGVTAMPAGALGVVVAIGALNEAESIAAVLEDLTTHGYDRVVVCDDGSRDNTSEIARSAGAIVPRHLLNRGAGAASRTAVEIALLLGADIVVTMDADGQHLAKDIRALVGELVSQNVDLVFGNRMHIPARVPRVRRVYNRFANLLTHALGGIRLSDTQSGFRAYSADAARQIKLRSSGYEYCSEIAREVRRQKLSYSQVPVEAVYHQFYGSRGQNLYNGFKTAWRLFMRLIN
jgi:glycosyltransferase involved in cell wall biosynthesis